MFSFKRKQKAAERPEADDEEAPPPAAPGDDTSFLEDDEAMPAGLRDGFDTTPEPPKRRFPLRPILMGLLVLVLGGALGIGGYVFTAVDTRDLIGLLDIADPAPKLSMQMPGREMVRKSLLTPPGGEGDPSVLKATPDDTPPPAVDPAKVPEPAKAPEPPKVEVPPAAAPAAGPEPEIRIGKKAPVTAQLPAADGSGPSMPNPRPPDMMPTYAALPARSEVKPLKEAPVKELVREARGVSLPVIAPDGRQSWKLYARPFDGPIDKPRLAVVVTDLGLDKNATEAAIAKLPAEVTLAFSPYAGDLPKWIKKAREAGHEVLIGLPAEPTGYPARDPGPLAIMLAAKPEENVSRLEAVLAKAGGYTGVLSAGSRFGAAPQQLVPVLDALRERGLLYVGDGASSAAPSAPVTTVVDQELFREAIEMKLNEVAIAARTQGRAVAVASAKPITFDRLVAWMNRLSDQGVVAAPASAVVQEPGGKS